VPADRTDPQDRSHPQDRSDPQEPAPSTLEPAPRRRRAARRPAGTDAAAELPTSPDPASSLSQAAAEPAVAPSKSPARPARKASRGRRAANLAVGDAELPTPELSTSAPATLVPPMSVAAATPAVTTTPAATTTPRRRGRAAVGSTLTEVTPTEDTAMGATATETPATEPASGPPVAGDPDSSPPRKATRSRRGRGVPAPAQDAATGDPAQPATVRAPDTAASATTDTPPESHPGPAPDSPPASSEPGGGRQAATRGAGARRRAVATPVFQAPQPVVLPRPLAMDPPVTSPTTTEDEDSTQTVDEGPGAADDSDGDGQPRRRRRGRRGRGGRGRTEGEAGEDRADQDDAGADDAAPAQGGNRPEAAPEPDEGDGSEAGSSRRRRRRRRRGGSDGEESTDDPPNTVVRTREPRPRRATGADSEGVRGLAGSTRLEAKRQRRRDGRPDRRRVPVITEAEFLARREAVERMMIVRNQGERTQIAVLEDGVLVEHFVTRGSSSAFAGNVYVGKVQNVLPSMEAAFVDIGKGRNAVLYAGEVNYDAAAMEGSPRPKTIQEALKSGQNVLVQVSKDPLGQKGARLTSQITLPGRYLVYVPEGSMTGISRKLPDTERNRLKTILKKIVPEDAGVIIRTAAEGASEEELTRDVERLQQQWEQMRKAADKATKSAPALVHAEPDLVVRVVRDVFNEDFTSLVVQGDAEWAKIEAYVSHVAPELMARVSRWTGQQDVFSAHRVDEQLTKALDRKVHLPSGGSLVIDRTEAMTVIDVNTGKFTGKGGNLEETVTKNNLEAAEEIVRQLRLRDVGGIIVIDFIDMVLESNRELVLRRLTECLGRDRTRHQVAEVTSLGLVQMTRKRVGTGLLEAYSETCEACNGRGVLIHLDGIPARSTSEPGAARSLAGPHGPVPRPPAVRPPAAEPNAIDPQADAVKTGLPGGPEHPALLEGAEQIAQEQVTVPAGVAEIPAFDPAAADGSAPAARPVRRRRRATGGGAASPAPDQQAVATE